MPGRVGMQELFIVVYYVSGPSMYFCFRCLVTYDTFALLPLLSMKEETRRIGFIREVPVSMHAYPRSPGPLEQLGV